ncbi:hypothetical protein GPECTOR_4g613 [Gonium pectorale]|uniref:Tbc2 translation factor, chloroplastic n=1 Tax=Gonium pectorale TaxID=33097 RepID=A0A150GXY3_GONPE|nr:hypothetical protein GPECTOR_4g613 [Gonium pectorale]|eukprot:KXZ54548.1 hypothetical protein GPECTOR_4g613 [Gonium pectorale]
MVDLGEGVVLQLGVPQAQTPPPGPSQYPGPDPPAAAGVLGLSGAGSALPLPHNPAPGERGHRRRARDLHEDPGPELDPALSIAPDGELSSLGRELGDLILDPELADDADLDPDWDPAARHLRARALTRQLRVAGSWRGVRDLLAAWGPDLDALHLSAAASRLRDVGPPPYSRAVGDRAQFRAFMAGYTELCGHYLPVMPPACLSNALYTLAEMGCPPPPAWMLAWLRAAAGRLAGFSPQDLANSMAALGSLEFDPGDPWLHRLCDAALDCMAAGGGGGGWGGEALGEGVWQQEGAEPEAGAAGGGAGVGNVASDADAPEVACPGAQQTALPSPPPSSSGPVHAAAAQPVAGPEPSQGPGPAFTPQGLGMLAFGFARLGFQPPERLLTALASEALRLLPEFNARNATNLLWALATLAYRPPDPWVARVASAALRLLPACTAYDLSLQLWALLRLGYTPDWGWLAGWLSASYRRLPGATPEQAARMLWCVAKVGLPPPEDWLRRWFSCVHPQLLEADPRALTCMVWAIATLGLRPERPWFDLLLVAAWERSLRSFAPHDLAMLMWGLAKADTLPEPAWMDEFWLVSYRRLPAFTPRALSLLLWSCVTLGQAPGPRWLAAYEQATLSCMYGQTPEGLSLMAYSYGMLEQTPPREWLLALYGAASRDDFADFTALGLERLIWGVARVSPPADARPTGQPGWIPAFLAAFEAQLSDTTYGNLANALYGLAMLGVRPGEAWLRAVMGRVEALLEDFGYTTAAKVRWALPLLAADGGAAPELLAHWQAAMEGRVRRMWVAEVRQRATQERTGRGYRRPRLTRAGQGGGAGAGADSVVGGGGGSAGGEAAPASGAPLRRRVARVLTPRAGARRGVQL